MSKHTAALVIPLSLLLGASPSARAQDAGSNPAGPPVLKEPIPVPSSPAAPTPKNPVAPVSITTAALSASITAPRPNDRHFRPAALNFQNLERHYHLAK
jgi:hypothetical protein